MRVVVLPGVEGTGDLFAGFVDEAPPCFQTEVVSYPLDRAFSYPEHVEHVRHRLPDVEEYVVVGESFSGPVAISLAADRPRGLAGMVLVNTFVRSPAWRGFSHLPWRFLFSLPISGFTIRLHLVGWSATSSMVNAIRRANRKVAPRTKAARIRAVFACDYRADLASISVPVMYLRGTKDRLVGAGSLATVLACKPSVSVTHIDGPHMILQVAPTESWRAIHEFIAEHFE